MLLPPPCPFAPADPRAEAGYYILTTGGLLPAQLDALNGSSLATAANHSLGLRVLVGPGGRKVRYSDRHRRVAYSCCATCIKASRAA